MWMVGVAWFGLLLAGFYLPAHGVIQLILLVGVATTKPADPKVYASLAAAVGAIELLLYILKVECATVGESGILKHYTKYGVGPWEHTGSQYYNTTSYESRNWIIAAVHSFALAGTYLACVHFGWLFAGMK